MRELIVVARSSALRAARSAEFTNAPGLDGNALANVLANVLAPDRAVIRPLFDNSADHIRPSGRAAFAAPLAESLASMPDLSKYYRVDAPDAQLDELAQRLRTLAVVEAAYVKPPTFPAAATMPPRADRMADAASGAPINEMLPTASAPPTTPDFTPQQGYLMAAPGGIDAVFAATQPGGAGAGIRIIDIEGAWRFTHEDLMQNQGGVVGGTPSADIGWRNHGTAVMGEMGGDVNGAGITGICPEANTRAISIFPNGSASAIRQAADLLTPGDVILVELHRPGPNAGGGGQQGFIAVEWWPDDFDAIRYATGRGVLVVEAAGNGAENLDDPAYDTPAAGFPATWANPFRRGARDSGAILVGAGAPPPGTHGRTVWGPDRSRLDFSNYGAAVDAQGWGREVTTTGYGDLQGGPNEDFWYTNEFSGTSSASPIVVGALGCAQGSRRARGTALLTPATARQLLRATGSPQQDAPGRPATQRIGNRPDLRQMIVGATPAILSTALYRYWNMAATDHFYTTNWSELGPGRYGWVLEGVQCFVFPQAAPGTVPLHRYWNPAIADHFYTTDWSELGGGRYGWGYEGIQGHVYTAPAANRVPVYRYWNSSVGDHFYTTNWNELGPGRLGYRFEGVQCYVATAQRPPSDGARAEPTAALTPDTAPNLVEHAPAGDSFGASGDVGPGEAAPPPSFATAGVASSPLAPASFAGVSADDAGRAGMSFDTTMRHPGSSAAEGATITIHLGAPGQRVQR
jgi:hypothetical protein